jgi:hypothetical protein
LAFLKGYLLQSGRYTQNPAGTILSAMAMFRKLSIAPAQLSRNAHRFGKWQWPSRFFVIDSVSQPGARFEAMNLNRLFCCCVIASALIGLLACSEGPCVQIQSHQFSIPPGMLALSLRWNGSGSLVFPSSHVDVLVTSGSDAPQTTTVLQNIEVAAFEQEKQDTAGTLTLLTTPNDAKKLADAAQKGRVQLVLRNQQRSGSFGSLWPI